MSPLMPEDSRYSQDPPEGKELRLNRRQLYGLLAGMGFCSVVGIAAVTDSDAAVESRDLRTQARECFERALSAVGENRRSALATVIESVVMWAVNMTVCGFMDKVGVEHGAHAVVGEAFEREFNEHPFRSALKMNLLIPIIEESIFRLAPVVFFLEGKSDPKSLHWEIGLPANVIFSAIHNFGQPEPGVFSLSLSSLPLEQFILGAFCWHAQQRGGFMHAAGAHVLYNSLCEAYERSSQTHSSDTAK